MEKRYLVKDAYDYLLLDYEQLIEFEKGTMSASVCKFSRTFFESENDVIEYVWKYYASFGVDEIEIIF